MNRSRIATVVCVDLTGNLRWADAPGNVALSARVTGLPEDSVADVSRIMTLDRNVLTECKLEQATDFPGNEHGLALHPQARRFPRGYSFTGLMSVGMAFRPSMACCIKGRITPRVSSIFFAAA